MILTAEYIRTNYLGNDAAHDNQVEELVKMVCGDVVAFIGQPVESEEVVWYFTGNGKHSKVCKHTLNVEVDSVEERLLIGGDWTEVSDVFLENGMLMASNGFVHGRAYRANLVVGLTPIEDAELLSSSFTDIGTYGDLLSVLCEKVCIKFGDTQNSNFGFRRLGFSTVSEGVNGSSRNFTLRDIDKEWQKKLYKYRAVESY